MSLTGTTLNGAITSSQTLITLTSATGLLNKQLVKVDNEWMRVTDVSLSPTIQVVRGYAAGTGLVNNGVATAHATLAPVTFGKFDDFTVQGTGPTLVSIGVDGAISLPLVNTIVTIEKATALAGTLVAPTNDMDGITLTITSATAAAHVVTASPATAEIFVDGTSAGPEEKITAAAFAGASIILEANAGLWNVLSNNQWTLGD